MIMRWRSLASCGTVWGQVALPLLVGCLLAAWPAAAAAGQTNERTVDRAQSASDFAMARVARLSSSRTPERRGPFAGLFQRPVTTRPNVLFGRPTLLDVNAGPSTLKGPCGLLLRDYRRGSDPGMVVPIAPGDFSVRQVVPQICGSR